jgi:CHAT domain-containing protein/Tfp pilus assembly protein PilF
MLKSCSYYVLSILLLLSAQASAQDHMALKQKAEDLYNQDNLQGAVATCDEALKLAEKKVGKEHAEYAEILHDLGIFHFYEGKAAQGIKEIETSLPIMQRTAGEKSKLYISSLSDLATIYYMTGDMLNAEINFSKAIRHDEANAGTKDHAILMASLAEVERSLGKVKESSAHFYKSREDFIKNRLARTNEYAQLLNNYAGLYHDLEQYTRAEQLYKEAELVFQQVGTKSNPDYITCMQNFGELYYEMEMYDLAREYYEETERLKLKMFGERSIEYASILNDLSLLYKSMGDYSKAEMLCSRSLNIKREVVGENDPGYLNTLHNYGMLCSALGRHAEAIEKVSTVVERMKPYKESHLLKYAEYSNSLASLYTGQQRFTEAEVLFQSIAALYEKSYGKESGYNATMSNLAYLYQVSGKAAKAEKIYLDLLQQKSDPNIQQNLGLLYYEQDKFKEAEPLLRKSLEYHKAKDPSLSPALLHSKINMGIVLDALDKKEEAMKLFTEGLDGYMKILSTSLAYMTEEERADLTENIYKRLGYFYTFAIDNSKQYPQLAAQAYNYRIATKGLLLSSLSRDREELLASGDTALINGYLRLKAQRNFLGKLYSLGSEELEDAAVNIDSLQRAADQLEKKLSLSLAIIRNNDPASVTWQQVQSALKPDEAAIEIIRITETFQDNTEGTTYAALILHKSAAQPELVLLRSGSGMENAYMANYSNRILDTQEDTSSYNIYWKTIASKLNGINTIYISADGVYNQLSIASLKDPVTGKYVQEKLDLHLVTNTRDIVQKQVAYGSKKAALFGFPDYTMGLGQDQGSRDAMAMRRNSSNSRAGKWILPELPGTLAEVEQIDSLLKQERWNTGVYLGKDATEQSLKKVHNPSVLHIATHGYFSANAPADTTGLTFTGMKRASGNPLLRSGLMLAGASNAWNETYDDVVMWTGREDGILTAYEAMSLDLDSTDLVVLSACETGLGEVKNGEGVYGLQRAFMVAGTKNVIMSLWPVSDEATQQLMTLFYRSWLKNENTHKAFRDAQDELKKKFPHPYYWAAFVLLER